MSGSGLVAYFNQESKEEDYQSSLSKSKSKATSTESTRSRSTRSISSTRQSLVSSSVSVSAEEYKSQTFENLQLYLSHRILGQAQAQQSQQSQENQDEEDDDDESFLPLLTKLGVGAYVHWTSSSEDDGSVNDNVDINNESDDNDSDQTEESPTIASHENEHAHDNRKAMANNVQEESQSSQSQTQTQMFCTQELPSSHWKPLNDSIQEYSPPEDNHELHHSQLETQPPQPVNVHVNVLQSLGQASASASISNSTTSMSTSPSTVTRKMSNPAISRETTTRTGMGRRRRRRSRTTINHDGTSSSLDTGPGVVPNDSRKNGKRKRQRQGHRKRQRPIPSIQTTSQHVTCIDDIDLHCQTISLDMLQVRLIWEYRKVKRMGKIVQDANSNTNNVVDLRHWQEDGPLARGFKHVLSMEVMEGGDAHNNRNAEHFNLEEEEGNEHQRNIQKRNAMIRQSATAAFCPSTSTSSSSTKKGPKKRIRLFFYNQYAEKMNRVLLHLRDKQLNTSTASSDIRDCLILSLRNIPACCIFPHEQPAVGKTAHQTLLDKDYGRLARYCICIGCDSLFHLQEAPSDDGDAAAGGTRNQRLSFDSNDMEVRVLRLIKQGGTIGKDLQDNEKEIVFRHENITHSGRNKVEIRSWEAEGSGMAKKYLKSHKQVVTSNEKVVASSSDDHGYQILSEIPNLIKQNRSKSKRKKEIDICGVVLAFTCPKVTVKKTFVMRIVLMDESLHRGNAPENATGISQFELNIFRNTLSSFPKVMRAGDVLFAHRVRPEGWNGKISIQSFDWSSFIVCRPTSEALKKYLQHTGILMSFSPTDYDSDWDVDNPKQIQLLLPRANKLWRYGHEYLCHHPLVNPSFQFSISNVCTRHQQFIRGGEDVISYGDIIAMLTDIFPFSNPTNNSPRGYLRIWDGTGPSNSDPKPPIFDKIPIEEPSSEILSSLACVVDYLRRDKEDSQIEGLQPPKSLCGKIMNVVIWEDSHWNFIRRSVANNQLTVGNFIHLRNVKERRLFQGEENTPRGLCVSADTMIIPVPDYSFDVKTLLQSHSVRERKKDPYNPNTGCLPLQIGEYVSKSLSSVTYRPWLASNFSPRQWCNLAEVITEACPAEFMTRFQVESINPPITEAFSLNDIRSLCVSRKGKDGLQTTEFQFILHVSDAVAELDIIVPNDTAEKIMGSSAIDVCARDISDQMKNEISIRLVNLLKDPWNALIHTVDVDGAKFAILEAISKISTTDNL